MVEPAGKALQLRPARMARTMARLRSWGVLAVGNVPGAVARPSRRQEGRLTGAAGRCSCSKTIRRQRVRAGSATGTELPRRFRVSGRRSQLGPQACADGHRPYSRLRLLLGRGPAVRLGDYDLEGGLRAWPPSAAERRAIDAAYEAAAAAARADSAARDAYEYARLGWLWSTRLDSQNASPRMSA